MSIVGTTLALIVVVGYCPVTKEQSWLKTRPSMSFSQRFESEGQIMTPGQTSMETTSAFIQECDMAMSRLAWIESEIIAYGSLTNNWDGPGSTAPNANHLRAAVTLLKLLPAGVPLPRPMLSSAGELGLYWDEPNLMADAAIESDSEFSLFLRARGRGGKEQFHDRISIDKAASSLMKDAFASI
jgi:hypothetical protein